MEHKCRLTLEVKQWKVGGGDLGGEAMEHWCRGENGGELVEVKCRVEIGVEAVEFRCRLKLVLKR